MLLSLDNHLTWCKLLSWRFITYMIVTILKLKKKRKKLKSLMKIDYYCRYTVEIFKSEIRIIGCQRIIFSGRPIEIFE